MCCSVLQCVAVGCSVLQWVASLCIPLAVCWGLRGVAASRCDTPQGPTAVCVAECCNVLQWVAVGCRVLQYVASITVCLFHCGCRGCARLLATLLCIMPHAAVCVAVCRGELKYVVVCCGVLQSVASVSQCPYVIVVRYSMLSYVVDSFVYWRVLQCVAMWCSVLQCVAVSCSVVQCGAVWCSELQ